MAEYCFQFQRFISQYNASHYSYPPWRLSLLGWEQMHSVRSPKQVGGCVIRKSGCEVFDPIKPKFNVFLIKSRSSTMTSKEPTSVYITHYCLCDISFSTTTNLSLALFIFSSRPCFSFLLRLFCLSLQAIFPIHFSSPPHDSSHESLEKPDLLGKVLGKQW